MTRLEFAQLFLNMGISVIPLRHWGKEPESSMMGETWEQYQPTLPTEYEVKKLACLRLVEFRRFDWMEQSCRH